MLGVGVFGLYRVLTPEQKPADHLLFVLGLLLIVKGFRRIALTITAFTVAHSVTLAAATLGLVRVPQPPVEAIIALSIVFVAAEIARGLRGKQGLTARAPWAVAFTFGLLHGFGFAGALAEVGLPQKAIPLAARARRAAVACAARRRRSPRCRCAPACSWCRCDLCPTVQSVAVR